MNEDINAVILFNEDSKANQEEVASNEDVLAISKRLLEENKEAYEVLAK